MNAPQATYERDHDLQAEMAADLQAHAIESARAACDAIRAIRDLRPETAAQICAVLSNRISRAGWAHWPEGVTAMELLDGCVDALTD